MMICPICTGITHRLFQKHEYWICECSACGHRCADVTPPSNHVTKVYGDHYFREGGDGYPDYLAESEIILAHGRYYGQLLSRYTKPGTVLDVGAAAGFVLKGLQENGWRGLGIEPNPGMADYACRQLGLEVKAGTLEGFQSGERYDLVSMIQVVAHFYDLRRAFQVAAELTKPGGFWLIETWNRASFMARLFGQNWHEYSPPSVLHWFSPEGLSRLAGQFGFSEVTRGRPPKSLKGSHAKSLIYYKLQNTALSRITGGLLKLIPDQLTLPYPNYDLFWILLKRR